MLIETNINTISHKICIENKKLFEQRKLKEKQSRWISLWFPVRLLRYFNDKSYFSYSLYQSALAT
jgi:hypothetical protein